MSYVIMSGKYETGTEEQKMGFSMLLGPDNTRYKFDLYFHWYNLVHELGHCIKSGTDVEMSNVKEEMFVNELAVGYYRLVGENERLLELQEIIENAVTNMPSPVPEGEDFIGFFERIWGTEQLMQVMVYGYLQLDSVLMALKNPVPFEKTLSKIGISVSSSDSLVKEQFPVVSENAGKVLDQAIENMKRLGIDVPEVRVELQQNPEIQCARPE